MRAFSEIDLFQVVSIKEKIMAGEASQSDLGDIETETFMKSIFREETFFSLFAEQKGLYDLIYQRLKEPSQDQSSSFLNENTTRIRMGCLPASVNTQFIQRVIACRELTTMVKQLLWRIYIGSFRWAQVIYCWATSNIGI